MTSIESMARAEQRRAEKDAKQARELFNKKVSSLLKHPEAEEVFHYILSLCEVLNDGFSPGNSDLTIHHTGKRNVGLQLLEIIGDADPEFVVKLIRREINAG